MPLILVVDTDSTSREALVSAIEEIAFETQTSSGDQLLDRVRERPPDALVLDIFPGPESGFALCRQLRENEATQSLPIVMITRSELETDRILALEAGADDVIARPFSAKEAALRVRGVIRRAQRLQLASGRDLRLGRMQIRRESRLVQLGDIEVHLSEREVSILRLLASMPGRVFSREEILREVWTDDEAVTIRVVDTHVKTMRRKLGEWGGILRTVRGVGYCLEEERGETNGDEL